MSPKKSAWAAITTARRDLVYFWGTTGNDVGSDTPSRQAVLP